MIRWQRISPEQQIPPLLRDLVIMEGNIEQLAMFKIIDPGFDGKVKNDAADLIKFDIDLQILP